MNYFGDTTPFILAAYALSIGTLVLLATYALRNRG